MIERTRLLAKSANLMCFKALEPKYQDVGDFKELDGYGINADYIRNLIKELGLLKKPLDNVCRKAAAITVKTIMHTPSEGEFVDESASLNEAVIQLLVGKHQSLLVTRGNDIIGILRLTDVFKKVSDMISACQTLMQVYGMVGPPPAIPYGFLPPVFDGLIFRCVAW
jgi:hypothetical protein